MTCFTLDMLQIKTNFQWQHVFNHIPPYNFIEFLLCGKFWGRSWSRKIQPSLLASLPLSWGMPVATSLTDACAVERCFIKFELLTFDVDKVFGLRHSVHVTCTFLPFTSTRLKYCLYFHRENAVLDSASGLAISSDMLCVCACVCVCARATTVCWFVCIPAHRVSLVGSTWNLCFSQSSLRIPPLPKGEKKAFLYASWVRCQFLNE